MFASFFHPLFQVLSFGKQRTYMIGVDDPALLEVFPILLVRDLVYWWFFLVLIVVPTSFAEVVRGTLFGTM